MATDDLTTEPGGDAGTTGAGNAAGDESQLSGGQSGTDNQGGTTKNGTGTGGDEILYNPDEYKTLLSELEGTGQADLAGQVKAFAKSLQGAFTKKTQSISELKQKADAYEAFSRDPAGQLQEMARRMGYQLSPAGGNNQQHQQGAGWTPESGENPKSWDEVAAYFEKRAEERILGKLQPALDQVGQFQKSTIENQLSEIDPSWKSYESDMIANLDKHPTLATDPEKLYLLSVPSHVRESRATQAALRKLRSQTQSGETSGASSTTKSKTAGIPDKALSFEEAVQVAKQQISEQGIRPRG